MQYSEYFADTAILPLFAIAVVWLLKKWNKEKRVAFLIVTGVSILFLYNGVTYAVAEKLGEADTYYRFFWICPIALAASLLVVELLFRVETSKRVLVLGVLAIGGFLFSSKLPSTWVNFPENIYQLDPDVIQVADTILELEDGNFTTIIDNGDIENTIRQYDARIGFTNLGTDDVDYVLEGKNTNYIGRYLVEYFSYNNSDYFVLRKDKPSVCRIVESIGLECVEESDNYYIYRMDKQRIQEDLTLVREYEIGHSFGSNLEYIPLENMEGTFEIIYLSDLGAVGSGTAYQEAMEGIKTLQPNCVIINSQSSENAGWHMAMQSELEQLSVPYYCNDKAFQTIEQDGFVLCLIDNSKEVSEDTIKSLEALNTKGTPIVLVVSMELNGNADLYAAVTAEDSQVVEVLTARKNEYYKCLLEDRVMQYAAPTDNNTFFNIVRVKGK